MVSEGAHSTVSWHPSGSTDIGLSCFFDGTLSPSEAKLDGCSLEKPVVTLRYRHCRRSVSAGGLRSRGLGQTWLCWLDMSDSEAASRC